MLAVYEAYDAPAESAPAQRCFAENLRAPALPDGLCLWHHALLKMQGPGCLRSHFTAQTRDRWQVVARMD